MFQTCPVTLFTHQLFDVRTNLLLHLPSKLQCHGGMRRFNQKEYIGGFGCFFYFSLQVKSDLYAINMLSEKKNCAFWEAIDSFYNQFINICANWPLRLRMFQSCLLLVNTQKKNTTSPPSKLLTLFPSHLRYCAQCTLYLLLLFHASYITGPRI